MPAPDRIPRWQRVLAPVVCFLGLFALLASQLPERLYGDDTFLVWTIVRDQVFAMHFLYVLAAEGAARLGARVGLDPFVSLRLLSAAGTAAGIVLLYLAARRRDVPQGIALAFALLVLTSASTWFFATAAEVHGLHLGALGLLAWTLAGTRPDSPSRQALWVALAFGVFAGTHKSGGLMLPGVLAFYAVATRGRPGRARLLDAAQFTGGGLVAVLALLTWNVVETGEPLGAQEGLAFYLEKFGLNWLGWRGIVGHLGTDLVAPAFALALLGASGLGACLRVRRAWAFVLAAALLPYLVFLVLWNYEERGAYFVVVLPVLSAAFLLALAGGEAPRTWAKASLLVLVGEAAAVGCLLTPETLLELLGPIGAATLCGVAFVCGFVLPRHRVLGAGGVAKLGLVLVLLQGLGAARSLARYDQERPVLDWGRDTCAALGEDDVLVLTGFSELYLLKLCRRPWPAPFAGTWEYAEETGPAPVVVDVGQLGPNAAEDVAALVAGGTPVHLLDRVPELFGDNELLGPTVRELTSAFELAPVVHGSFRAHRLLAKP